MKSIGLIKHVKFFCFYLNSWDESSWPAITVAAGKHLGQHLVSVAATDSQTSEKLKNCQLTHHQKCGHLRVAPIPFLLQLSLPAASVEEVAFMFTLVVVLETDVVSFFPFVKTLRQWEAHKTAGNGLWHWLNRRSSNRKTRTLQTF